MQIGILPPELKSMEQLLTGDIQYSVPKYQRSFAWGHDETEELWEDLMAAVTRQSVYFLGTIVLHTKHLAPLEIIDGQQRLACITMIFSAIRNVFRANRDPRENQIMLAFLAAKGFSRESAPNPKLALNHVNNETFVQYVIESENREAVQAMLKSRALHASNRLLLQAYEYFLSQVIQEVGARGTQADDFLVPLINCLKNKVKLITIPVTSEDDANLFFESLNARGKELAISDLVKNRLYLEAREKVSDAQQLWDRMEIELGRKPIPEYLRHFWIAKKADSKTLNVREKQLYRMITQDIGGKSSSALELLRDLRQSALDYARISDYDLWPNAPAYNASFEETLEDLHLFRVSQCNPLLLNAIQHFGDPQKIARVFQVVVNFSFRYFIIGNQSPGNLERVSASIAHEIRTGTYASPADVADALRAVNPDPTFRSDFTFAIIPKSRARIARYALRKISNHMLQQSSGLGTEQIVNPDPRQVTLEHVLPQANPKAWGSSFSKGLDPADYVERIGNLTLLASKVNRDAADASFVEKKRIALDESSLAINKHFGPLSQWGDKEIEQRQESLAKIALAVWKL